MSRLRPQPRSLKNIENPEKQRNPANESKTPPVPAIEPSVSLSAEETSLLLEGVENLPIERKKTVVFDRLAMKLSKAKNYWDKIEKLREERKSQLADQLLENQNESK